jgi:4-aminobutyrate aminotransferase-like enzyme
MPLTGVCGRAEIMDAPAPGGLGGTYAGNPLALAAANAVLDIFEQEGLLARANVLGARLKETLETLRSAVPQIAEVRGLGAMIGVEFCQSGSNTPNPEFAKQVQARALNRGLLLLTCGIYANVIRFMFPLTISDPLMVEGIEILTSALLDSAVK